MFRFSRKAAARRVVSVRPAAIEGLEGRVLLSGSPGGSGGGNSGGGPGPSVNVPQQNPNSGKSVSVEIKGVATAINATAGTVTVAEEHNGPIVTFTIPSAATVTVKDTVGGLAAIKVGAEVDFHLSAAGGTVVSLSAENPHAAGNDPNENEGVNEAEGVVKLVDTVKMQITVTAEHSTTATVFTIPTTAKITVDGKPGTLAGIAVGSKIEIHFAADGTTIVGVEVTSVVVAS